MEYLKAIVLALVEGVTEFLPISSTGHMILVEELISFADESFAKSFIVIIQLPAILAVVLYFWKDLWPWHRENGTGETIRIWFKIAVAFIPAAILGPLLDDQIESMLSSSAVVAAALIVGGIIIIVIERMKHVERYPTVHELTFGIAFAIGCFQCLAMIPGTSRSAATIIGALLLGASRGAAAEFSFFLAIPTMLGATAFTVFKNGLAFSGTQWTLLLLGSVISFVTAYVVIAFLMQFIKRHSFAAFGWYRIVLGIVVLASLYFMVGEVTTTEL